MNRYRYIQPKVIFEMSLVLDYINNNPGKTSIQITKALKSTYGLNITTTNVMATILILRKKKKVKIQNEFNSMNGVTFEAI